MLWRRLIADLRFADGPSWSDGRVYVQFGDNRRHGVSCFAGDSGTPLWTTDLSTPDSSFEAPLVFGDGVWVRGNFANGVHGLGTNGALRFLTPITTFGAGNGSTWTPSYYRGAVYCWDTVEFTAVDLRSGLKRARAEEALDLVWEFIAFILNAIVFLLIGVATSVGDLGAALPATVWGVVAILAGRAIVIYGLLGIPARLAHTARGTPAIPVPWLHVMFWAGLRGAGRRT